MRDARFVGLAADGDALIVEHDGEHLRLPLDGRVRAALAGGAQMPMPLQTRVTPREVQHRIRGGESAAQIAAESGVAVELIARFEGPVLDERRWQADRARHTVVDGTPLAERLAAAASPDGGTAPGAAAADAADEAVWDAWVSDDGGWRVAATLPDGRRPEWTWDPRTRRLRGRDDLARLALSGSIARDDLEAVLRPIAAARQAREPLPAYDAPPEPPDEPGAGPSAEPAGEAAGEPVGPAREPTPEPAEKPARRPGLRRRRTPVPSWDDIVGSSPRRPPGKPD